MAQKTARALLSEAARAHGWERALGYPFNCERWERDGEHVYVQFDRRERVTVARFRDGDLPAQGKTEAVLELLVTPKEG